MFYAKITRLNEHYLCIYTVVVGTQQISSSTINVLSRSLVLKKKARNEDMTKDLCVYQNLEYLL